MSLKHLIGFNVYDKSGTSITGHEALRQLQTITKIFLMISNIKGEKEQELKLMP